MAGEQTPLEKQLSAGEFSLKDLMFFTLLEDKRLRKKIRNIEASNSLKLGTIARETHKPSGRDQLI